MFLKIVDLEPAFILTGLHFTSYYLTRGVDIDFWNEELLGCLVWLSWLLEVILLFLCKLY